MVSIVSWPSQTFFFLANQIPGLTYFINPRQCLLSFHFRKTTDQRLRNTKTQKPTRHNRQVLLTTRNV